MLTTRTQPAKISFALSVTGLISIPFKPKLSFVLKGNLAQLCIAPESIIYVHMVDFVVHVCD
jgi:hypothetical protein